MSVAICIPSRGLIHSRTIDMVEHNRGYIEQFGVSTRLFVSHDRPIPEGHNILVEMAINLGFEYIWMIEEDNLPPKANTLVEMLDKQGKKGDIIALDYPVGKKKYSSVCLVDGSVAWCGLGCILIPVKILKDLGKPHFRNDVSYQIESIDPLTLKKVDVDNKYGGHDIDFGIRVNKAGYKIAILDEMCPHLKIAAYGDSKTNSGLHQIEAWTKIEHEQQYRGPLTVS